MQRFLIVDDDPAGRRLVRHFLEPFARCDQAVNGEEAIAAFRLALDEGRPYDLVCLDIMMPGVDGHAVLQEMRQIEQARGILGSDGVKVVMITALDDPKHCIRAFNEGCESYIAKPIYEHRLLMEVQSLLGELHGFSESRGEQAARPRRFLIVDDDRLCRELLRDILSKYGRCDFAYNGQEAIDAHRLALEDQDPYNMVCLDIMMPGFSGHQALEGMRKTEQQFGIFGNDGVPVIMTTALRDSRQCMQAFREGCEAYLTKPIRREALLARMQEMKVLPGAVPAQT